MEDEEVQAHVFISGRVQGVFFRATTRDIAKKLGLRGWVRNLRDGRVEAVFQGKKSDVEKAIEWCHHGPSLAKVENVEVIWEKISERYEDFEIRY
ncbi:MAG TPA: acylphosphatase [Candidatus Altiarchaeales archaeon]|nr:acylphosphatase [Candidatus Altiarchaeales archaeon]